MSFDFKKNLIKVQGGRTYLPVSARIVWFREQHPDWGIITEAVEINHEKQYAVFRATVFNAEGKIMATGTKKEDVKGFGDYIEKVETGAVGRALALCGFGTQFSPELDEVGGGRLADSPQPMGGGRYGGATMAGRRRELRRRQPLRQRRRRKLRRQQWRGRQPPLRAAPRSERAREIPPRYEYPDGRGNAARCRPVTRAAPGPRADERRR